VVPEAPEVLREVQEGAQSTLKGTVEEESHKTRNNYKTKL